MKPAEFDYFAPASIDEALETLSRLGYGGKVLAGGQSLVPSMNFRLAQPAALVDLNRIPELSYIKFSDNGELLIGAMTRDSQVENDPQVARRFPVIVEAFHFVGHPQIRNRGTFGGAIAHADPTAQMPAVLLALNGRCHIRSKTASRWVPAEEFFVGPFTSVINPDELLVEVAIPPMAPRSGASYQQMARQAGAQALVGVVAYVVLDDRKRCKEARLALLSVGMTPIFAKESARLLVGKEPARALIQAAADMAADKEIDPGGDIHCSVEFRRHLARTLTAQTLQAAFDRAAQRGG
jgi:aerobic carbon-monoxide dehydrogenase medium subunit